MGRSMFMGACAKDAPGPSGVRLERDNRNVRVRTDPAACSEHRRHQRIGGSGIGGGLGGRLGGGLGHLVRQVDLLLLLLLLE